MLRIDGSYLEGGGQILRTALAMSTISQVPFEIHDIRKGRKDSGLKNQHLHCIRALQKLTNSIAEGAELGSSSVRYYPKKIVAKNLEIDVETAGSVTLLLQSLLIPSMFSSKSIAIRLTGGTDVRWSMPFDYLGNVLMPQIQRFCRIEAKLLKRGYYPKGSGEVEVRLSPKYKINGYSGFGEFRSVLKTDVNGFDLVEQGHLIQIKGISHASRNLENARVAERQTEASANVLRKKYNVPVKIISEYQDTLSTGSGVTLWAIFSKKLDDIDENNPIRLGADSLGEQ